MQEEQGAGRQLVSRRASTRKQSGTRSEKLGATDRSLTFTTRCTPTPFLKVIWSKAQIMGFKFYQTFSHGLVHFGDIPAECIARVIGHDQTILYERPSDVALCASAIQADVRASGDRLLDQDRCHKELCEFHFAISKRRRANESTPSQYQDKGTEVDER